jgi:phospholipid transport system substrate-binding protein
MRRMLVTTLAAVAALAGWASPAGTQSFPTVGPVLVSFPVIGPIAPAPLIAPDVLLKAVTSEVITIIRQDKDIQTGNPAKVADLVETRILPHFDFARMTQIAVARNWRLATPEQQEALTTEFKTLLVRTYSAALSSNRDRVIEYKPLRAALDATEVTVRSTVKQPGAERTAIHYEMEKTSAGWKVYDIKIAGISLISAYQSTFGQTIRSGGVDGLIRSLSARNRQADSELRAQDSGARPFLFILYAVIPGVFHSSR